MAESDAVDLRALVRFVRNQTHQALTTQHKMADAIESLLARAEAAEAECARLERAARAFQASTAEFQNECARLRQDAERYEWAVENAVIETQQWRHDGRDPSSTKYVLDRAIDAAIAEGKHEVGR